MARSYRSISAARMKYKYSSHISADRIQSSRRDQAGRLLELSMISEGPMT